MWYMEGLIDIPRKHDTGYVGKSAYQYRKVPTLREESRKAYQSNVLHILCAKKSH
jgi:hypothetical protein